MWNVIAQETLSSSGPCSSSKPSNSPIFDVHSPSYPLVSILTSYTPHLVDALYGAILVFFGLFFWISPSLALVIHISPSGLPGGWRLIGALKHDVGTASRLYMLPCRSLWCLLGSLSIFSPEDHGFLDVLVLLALHFTDDMDRAFG